MDPFEIEIAITAQKIINAQAAPTGVDEPAVEAILAAATSEIRSAVIQLFRTNEELRMFFPEYAMYFDNRWAA